MSLRLLAASSTDVGRQREQNEDACYTQVAEEEQRPTGLFIVADGMGGYHAGEIASQIAVETIRDGLQPLLGPASAQVTLPLERPKSRNRRRNKSSSTAARAADKGVMSETTSDTPGDTRSDTTAEAPEDTGATQHLDESIALEHYAKQLRTIVERASEEVVAYGHEHREAQGLGSTLTATLVIDGTAFIANVGDSRTYLLRKGTLQRITQDHSLVEQLVQAGQITRDEAYEHPSRNLIYRSLGAGKAEVAVDIFTEQLQDGDALLLCSDGLWEMVRDPEIESILNEVPDPIEATRLLTERANEHGGEDNITAVLVRCVAS